MKEMRKLKKIARKHRGEEYSEIRRSLSKLYVKLRLEDRPWLVSLTVLLGILIIGLGVSSIFGVPPTPLPTVLGYPDGTACYQDSDCQSFFCTLDTDGSRYCAPAGSCVRKEAGTVKIYPSTGTFPVDTADADLVGYRCDMGFWSEDPFSSTHTFVRITFTEAGGDTSAFIYVPKKSVVREASLYVYAIPAYQVSLEDDFQKAGVIRGYSVQVKQIEGESKIVLTDLSGKPLGTYEYHDGVDWLGYDFSISTASVDGRTKVILAARSQDTFAIYSIGRYQITNPTVDIGANGVNWEHTGKFTPASGPQRIDFTGDLAAIIEACAPVDGLCTIPIKVTSDSPGTIILSNLKIGLNSPPKLTAVTLDPPIATYGEPISCTPTATDADGDQLSYKFKWLRNGIPSDVISNILPPEKVQKGDLWKCAVTPLDIYAEGIELSSREVYIAGLPDYSACSAAYQCDSDFCVNEVCCFSDPCPGDNICSPGEDGTSDDECCIPGDGTCTGGCSEIDTDCTVIWSASELQESEAEIVVQSTRNDKKLIARVIDKDKKPLSRVPLKVSIQGGATLTLYTNSDGYVAIPVDWGDRVTLALAVADTEVASADVVVRKNPELEGYEDEEIGKLGFGETTEASEIEWTQTELRAKELVISFPQEIIRGAPVVVLVTDGQGNPVAGVPVTLMTTEGMVTIITNNLGLATIQEYAGDPLRVRIEKDGYALASEEVTFVSTRISYWAVIPVLVLIIPLIIFFVFSTVRGRATGFGVKPVPPLVEPKPKVSEVPKGMDTSAYAKELHTLRQSPATAQVLEHLESARALIGQRDYTGAQQEIKLSRKLYSKISTSLRGDAGRIISAKLAAAEEEVDAAYKKQLEMLKHAPAAQKILEHMKFIEGRITEVQKIDSELRKSVSSKISAIVTPAFVKGHPEEADGILQEIDGTLQTQIYDEVDGLIAHLNNLRNNLLEARSEKVLTMEGMSEREVNRAISGKRRELSSRVEYITEHFRLKVESVP